MARTRAHSCREKANSHPTVVIPGREAKRSEPGIHPTAIIAVQWIPGLRQAAHPGMTTERASRGRHAGRTDDWLRGVLRVRVRDQRLQRDFSCLRFIP